MCTMTTPGKNIVNECIKAAIEEGAPFTSYEIALAARESPNATGHDFSRAEVGAYVRELYNKQNALFADVAVSKMEAGAPLVYFPIKSGSKIHAAYVTYRDNATAPEDTSNFKVGTVAASEFRSGNLSGWAHVNTAKGAFLFKMPTGLGGARKVREIRAAMADSAPTQ